MPATYDDDLSDWDRGKNPAFAYCDARCWLAERDGRIVAALRVPAWAQVKDSTPEEADFTVYDDIREKLVARGIPREQIAFIHEANTEARKKELFSKVRSGQVRVLMGSTLQMPDDPHGNAAPSGNCLRRHEQSRSRCGNQPPLEY